MDTNIKTTIHSRKNIIIAIVVGLVLVIGVVYAVKYKKSTMRPGGSLTEEQKKQILDTLSRTTTPSEPLTEKQKTAIIQSLSRTATPSKPLTEEQKTTILQSLSH